MRKMIEQEIKLSEAFDRIKHKCKCGHTVHVKSKLDFVYCDWCGRRVFRTEKIEFKRKLLRACGKDDNDQVSQ